MCICICKYSYLILNRKKRKPYTTEIFPTFYNFKASLTGSESHTRLLNKTQAPFPSAVAWRSLYPTQAAKAWRSLHPTKPCLRSPPRLKGNLLFLRTTTTAHSYQDSTGSPMLLTSLGRFRKVIPTKEKTLKDPRELEGDPLSRPHWELLTAQ